MSERTISVITSAQFDGALKYVSRRSEETCHSGVDKKRRIDHLFAQKEIILAV